MIAGVAEAAEVAVAPSVALLAVCLVIPEGSDSPPQAVVAP